MTKKEIIQALKNKFTDYEDSIQYSSALTIKDLDVIVTSNIERLQKLFNCGNDSYEFSKNERKNLK